MEENKQELPNDDLENKSTEESQNSLSATPQEDSENSSPYAPTASEPAQDIANTQFGYQYADVKLVYNSVENIKNEVAKVVVGQENLVELLLTGLFTGGHCLIEGLPGIAKTLTARLLAKTINSKFSRIQFTPDLMPTDITGTSVFNMKESEFYFKEGPIFASIILIDEINRAPAKTQAALMEVMEEHQLTYDGKTYPMNYPFFVIATQNPIEQEGTYQLPEAQLDRFVFKLKINYPNPTDELQILEMFQGDFDNKKEDDVKPIITADEIQKCHDIIQKVHIKPSLLKYITDIIVNTRNNIDLYLGASPRASLAIMKTSKAIAAIKGRDFVVPEDIQEVCYPVLNHRIILSHEREMEGTTVEEIIKEIIEEIEVPR